MNNQQFNIKQISMEKIYYKINDQNINIIK